MNAAGEAFDQADVDGELIYIPSHSTWDVIQRTSEFLGRRVSLFGTEELGQRLLVFVRSHEDDFFLGIHRLRSSQNWSVLPLFRGSQGLQRVHVERVECISCGTSVRIGNSTDATIYYGSPDDMAAVRRAFASKPVPCPSCGGTIGRHAVWAKISPRKSTNA
jgi:predicted RNA-binding Zn-ribbon protein involved in translation (DUF1610 family)